jgi:glycine cleavage system regulatory protein
VSSEQADQVVAALAKLEAEGLKVQWVRSDGPAQSAGNRKLRLEMTGADRPGIVRELSIGLTERGVSIEDLQTEILQTDGSPQFKVLATLWVPAQLTDDTLRGMLESLAHQMMMDIGLDASSA